MPAIPSLLDYEINDVEFNFRVYKFVMCSSFLLPFCMAGWRWQTYFVRRAASGLTKPLHPLLSCPSSNLHSQLWERDAIHSRGFHNWKRVSLLLSQGQVLWGNFCKRDCRLVSQQRAHCPSVVAPEPLPPSLGWTANPTGRARAAGGSETGSLGRKEVKSILREKIKSNHFRSESVTFKIKGLPRCC